MRVGSLVFATDQGLGYLAKSFYDNDVLTDVLVVRHGRRPDHFEWYPNQPILGDVHDRVTTHEFCQRMDVMFFLETPFDWSLINFCREVGVRTVLMPMHECEPDPLPAAPDLMLCPSMLDYDCFSTVFSGDERPTEIHVRSVFLPVPVDVPWRQRAKAKVFIHNAGNGGLRGRNGTAELLQAWRYVKSDAKLILRSQVHQDWPPYPELLGKVELTTGVVPYDQLWDKGDVFVFPEKFNGLSLPLQEAYASGMAVMATDRYPINTWLPPQVLIPTSGSHKTRIAKHLREFDEAEVDPKAIAAKIDSWYGCDISQVSQEGRAWAGENSWAKLKPRYMEALCE